MFWIDSNLAQGHRLLPENLLKSQLLFRTCVRHETHIPGSNSFPIILNLKLLNSTLFKKIKKLNDNIKIITSI